MSPEIAKRIQEAVALGGKALEDNLPPDPKHQERNPYAHIWRCIKTKMGKSYRECEDNQEQEIIDYISYLVENPF
jgi:hypothetical protein